MSGKISRRVRTCATSRGMRSPAFTRSLSFLITTLPRSIAGERSNVRTRPFTFSSFCGATWAIVITSEVPHRGAHRRLHVGGLDVEPPALELPKDPSHQEVQVVRDVLGGHVPRANRGVERPLVTGA